MWLSKSLCVICGIRSSEERDLAKKVMEKNLKREREKDVASRGFVWTRCFCFECHLQSLCMAKTIQYLFEIFFPPHYSRKYRTIIIVVATQWVYLKRNENLNKLDIDDWKLPVGTGRYFSKCVVNVMRNKKFIFEQW